MGLRSKPPSPEVPRPQVLPCEILVRFTYAGRLFTPGEIAPRIAYFSPVEAEALEASGQVRIRGGR